MLWNERSPWACVVVLRYYKAPVPVLWPYGREGAVRSANGIARTSPRTLKMTRRSSAASGERGSAVPSAQSEPPGIVRPVARPVATLSSVQRKRSPRRVETHSVVFEAQTGGQLVWL